MLCSDKKRSFALLYHQNYSILHLKQNYYSAFIEVSCSEQPFRVIYITKITTKYFLYINNIDMRQQWYDIHTYVIQLVIWLWIYWNNYVLPCSFFTKFSREIDNIGETFHSIAFWRVLFCSTWTKFIMESHEWDTWSVREITCILYEILAWLNDWRIFDKDLEIGIFLRFILQLI